MVNNNLTPAGGSTANPRRPRVYSNVADRIRPGVASRHIRQLDDHLRTCAEPPPAILFIRVSPGDSNPEAMRRARIQRARLIREVEQRGCTVIYAPMDVVETSNIYGYRPHLMRAIEIAREQGAIIVAMYRDRIMRNRHFDGTNVSEQPTEWEYRELDRLRGEVVVCTFRHPDFTPGAARSDQIIHGQAVAEHHHHQHPLLSRKERKRRCAPRVKELRHAGHSYREIKQIIVDELGIKVSPPTILAWCREGD